MAVHVEQNDGSIAGIAWVSDPDHAADLVRSEALDTWGNTTCIDVEELHVLDTTPEHPGRALALARAARLGGSVVAVPLASVKQWKLRRQTLRVTTWIPGLPLEAGVLDTLPAAVESFLRRCAEEVGNPPQAHELLCAVELRRARGKRRGVLQNNTGLMQRRYELRGADGVISLHTTAVEARRAAKAAATDGEIGAVFSVWGRQGREGEQPLATATTELARYSATVRLVWAEPKRPERIRTDGWLVLAPNPQQQ